MRSSARCACTEAIAWRWRSGGATPESKLAEVAAAQARGLKVGMVGDGINDAPVLARADASVAMGQGALVTRAQADAVVASNRLGDLVLAHDLAKRCMAVVRQNMLWAATYNAVCIPLALVGWLPPWAAGLGMATSSVLVIGNSMRLARPLQLDPNTQLTQPDMQPPTGALRAFPPEGEASPGATAVRN